MRPAPLQPNFPPAGPSHSSTFHNQPSSSTSAATAAPTPHSSSTQPPPTAAQLASTTTKDAHRQITQLFSPNSPSNHELFETLSLPSSLVQVIDSRLSHFSSSLSNDTERERERVRWRQCLSDTWTVVEPLPGDEGNPHEIARVSAFLDLLERLSSGTGDGDEGAIITKADVGEHWWGLVVRRCILGTPKEVLGGHGNAQGGGGGGSGSAGSNIASGDKGLQERGRKTTPRWGVAAVPKLVQHQSFSSVHSTTSSTGGSPTPAMISVSPSGATVTSTTRRPLAISSNALAGAKSIVSWAMTSSRYGHQGSATSVPLSPFGVKVWDELRDRINAGLMGLDEEYGVENLKECIIDWADKSPETFFHTIVPKLTEYQLSRLPFLSLLVSFLCKHSSKSQHVLKTPLITELSLMALKSPSFAIVTLATTSLAILMVMLTSLYGKENVVEAMKVYARLVSWEKASDNPDFREEELGFEDVPTEESFNSGDPPDPTMLFTILYGLYPCNFTEFLRDPLGYLERQQSPSTVYAIEPSVVKDLSQPIMRQHTLNPLLFTSDSAKEFNDKSRWSHGEAFDVMAQCGLNVLLESQPQPIEEGREERGGDTLDEERTVEEPLGRSLIFGLGLGERGTGGSNSDEEDTPKPTSPIRTAADRDLEDFSGPLRHDPDSDEEEEDANRANVVTRETTGSPPPPPGGRISSRSTSRVRALLSSPTPSGSSRSQTPLLPATSHFVNFQALQQQQHQHQQHLPPTSSSSPSRHRAESPLSRTAFSEDEGMINSATLSRHVSLARKSSTRTAGTTTSGGGFGPGASGVIGGGGAANSKLLKLHAELEVLKGEVRFQTYLKGLHLAHMGTLHRQKVLESGAEAERQGLARTVRSLRGQLKQGKTSFAQLKSEYDASKLNWGGHIADLQSKLKTSRAEKDLWKSEEQGLRSKVEELKELLAKQGKELETQGAAFFDLQNQVELDKEKLDRIDEYQRRIESLTATITVCDADLAKFRTQEMEMDALVAEYKRSEMLRESAEERVKQLEGQIRSHETTLVDVHNAYPNGLPSSSTGLAAAAASTSSSAPPLPQFMAKDTLQALRQEMERLRVRNEELEEAVRDGASAAASPKE